MRKSLAAGAAGVLLIAGCSSSGQPGASPFVTAVTDVGSSPPVETAYPGDDLTSYGATVTNFAAHHDSDPKYVPGCCYGAPVTMSDGGSADTYNLSGNTSPLVINLTRNFPASTDERTALALISTQDLPGDIVPVKTVDQGTCKVFVYTSATLASVAPAADLGQTVSINLYPPSSSTNLPYTASDVQDAIISSGDGSQYGC